MIIKLELTDAETPVTNLQLSLVTDNPTLIKPEDYTFMYFFVDNHRYLTMAGAFGQTGTAHNTVTVSDGTYTASTTFTIDVLPPPPNATRFSNTNGFTIPDSGVASVYPSAINVSGVTGIVSNVTLNISRMYHERTTDLSMLLVGPTGVGVVFLSNVAGANPTGRNPPANDSNNVTFSVTDTAAFPFDPSFPIWSEVFRPTNLASSNVFPAPAPAGPYATTAFSNYNNISPNGTWKLFVNDIVSPGHGSIAGWSLMITTIPTCPTISSIPDQATSTNTATAAIPFTVGDPDTPLTSLQLTGSSSNTTLVPNGNIVFGGSGRTGPSL